MATKWQKVDIPIPPDLPPEDREKLAGDIIEFIVDRTEKGVDRKGKEFPEYSEEYIKSLDFKIAGKSKSDINLTLSGDMLAALKLIKHKRGQITIGFERGSEENARADGNIRGTYGTDKPSRKKARDFLGIETKDLKRILDFYVQGDE